MQSLMIHGATDLKKLPDPSFNYNRFAQKSGCSVSFFKLFAGRNFHVVFD